MAAILADLCRAAVQPQLNCSDNTVQSAAEHRNAFFSPVQNVETDYEVSAGALLACGAVTEILFVKIFLSTTCLTRY